MAYPVSVAVEPQLTNRNRLTTAFRLILAIPHLILVGGIGASIVIRSGDSDTTSSAVKAGCSAAVALLLAIVSWFTIVFTREHIAGIRQYTLFYLRWRVRGARLPDAAGGSVPAVRRRAVSGVADVRRSGQAARSSDASVFGCSSAIPHFIVLFFLVVRAGG